MKKNDFAQFLVLRNCCLFSCLSVCFSKMTARDFTDSPNGKLGKNKWFLRIATYVVVVVTVAVVVCTHVQQTTVFFNIELFSFDNTIIGERKRKGRIDRKKTREREKEE